MAHKHTCFLAITACQTVRTCGQLGEGFLRRPSSNCTGPNGIEPTDYSLPSAVGAALALQGITRESLPRTGRATLMASSSTGMQWTLIAKTSGGVVSPLPLSRLAPTLPGPLRPTSTTPSHVFHAGFEGRVPYGGNRYKGYEKLAVPARKRLRRRRFQQRLAQSKWLSARPRAAPRNPAPRARGISPSTSPLLIPGVTTPEPAARAPQEAPKSRTIQCFERSHTCSTQFMHCGRIGIPSFSVRNTTRGAIRPSALEAVA